MSIGRMHTLLQRSVIVLRQIEMVQQRPTVELSRLIRAKALQLRLQHQLLLAMRPPLNSGLAVRVSRGAPR
jgi:hypothetical protein